MGITPPRSRIRFFISAGTLLVSASILGGLLYQQKETILTYQWQVRLEPLILSFILFSIAFFFAIYLWASILQHLGIKVQYRKHFRHYSIANLAKRIPGTVWYVASRTQLYKDEGIPWQSTTLASAVEVAITLASGSVVSLVFGFAIIQYYQVNPWILIFFLLGSLLMLHPNVLGWFLARSKTDVTKFQYTTLIKWVFGYAFIWIMGGIILFSIGNIFQPISFSLLGYMIGSWVIVGTLSNALFFSPSNLGITEVGLSLLLSRVMPPPIAILTSVMTRIILLSYDFFWAAIALWQSR